jgi:methylmalonyl-CoA mutase cobalamin-binding domain/chain
MNIGSSKKEIVGRLKNAIMDADFDSTPKITREALEAGVEPDVLMEKAIGEAIRDLEEKFFGSHKVTMHPVFFMSMESARRSLEILEPWFKNEKNSLGTVVLGVPAGDVHDLGAKILAIALTAAGFKVVYLGRDVPSSLFVHKLMETGARILMISSYQTTGFRRIEEILELLSEAKMRDTVKVMVGGSVITEKFADKHNLGYARTASGGVKLAYKYIGGN